MLVRSILHFFLSVLYNIISNIIAKCVIIVRILLLVPVFWRVFNSCFFCFAPRVLLSSCLVDNLVNYLFSLLFLFVEFSFRPQSLLQLSDAIFLMPCLPMGHLTIAVTIVCRFTLHAARLFAFRQISCTMSANFTDVAFNSDHRIIRSMHCLAAAPSMPKQSLGDWTMSWRKVTFFAKVIHCRAIEHKSESIDHSHTCITSLNRRTKVVKHDRQRIVKKTG